MALSRVSPAGDWPAEILEAARETFNGHLTLYRPGEPGTYDSKTNTFAGGTPDEVLIADRPARAQHIRLPQEYNDGNGWGTKRRYRFQCEILEDDPAITKGLFVRFSGGRDPELEKVAFQVVSATNSSHAALRTIETVSELARVPA